MGIVLISEFQNCRTDLERDTDLSEDTFVQISERFQKLMSVVHKLDEMFSDLVALSLLLALGVPCAAVHAILTHNGSVKGWTNPILISVIIFCLLLLQPLATLNSEAHGIVGVIQQ